MEQLNNQMNKAVEKYVATVVERLSTQYNFDAAEALAFLKPTAEEKGRGRPGKQVKKVVNKSEMVEEVITELLSVEDLQTAGHAVVTEENTPAPVVVEPVVAEKKKVTKKKVVAAPPSLLDEVLTEETTAAVPVTVAPVKKKIVITAEEKLAKEAAKAAEKEAERLAKEAEKETARLAKEAEKELAKKAKEAEKEAAKLAKEAEKKLAPKKKSPSPAPAETEPVLAAVPKKKKVVAAPVEVVATPVVIVQPAAPAAELESEEMGEEGAAKLWTYKTVDYYKSCDNNCEVLNCMCTGAVYDSETQEPIGMWDGTNIVAQSDSEED